MARRAMAASAVALGITGPMAGWDHDHLEIVKTYFRLSPGWGEPVGQRLTPPGHRSDPLLAVRAFQSEDATDVPAGG